MSAGDGPVVVIGGGLIGGSVAAATRGTGRGPVVLVDPDPVARRVAAERGLADEIAATFEQVVPHASLVVVAVPPAIAAEVTATVLDLAGPGVTVTDCTSLKRQFILDLNKRLSVDPGSGDRQLGVDGDAYGAPAATSEASRGLAAAARLVPGHPMAGSEVSGTAAADGRLFQGATWVLTPTEATDDDALATVSRFVGRLGARVLVLSPDGHDRAVALVSHLPHVAAAVLAELVADEVTGDPNDPGPGEQDAALAVAGAGFRDTTRIAAGDPDLWVAILAGNRTAVLHALQRYRLGLDALTAALEDRRWDAVQEVLARGAAARRRLPRKEALTAWVDLVIALSDQPGALARATQALGAAGVNIEDLAMRHASAERRGALVVRVAASAADTAVGVLGATGLTVHVEAGDEATGA